MENQEKVTTRINKRIFKKLKEESFKEDKSLQEIINSILELGLRAKYNVSSDLFSDILLSRKTSKFVTNEEERNILDSSRDPL